MLAQLSSTKQGGSVNYGLTREWVAKARGTSPNALDFAAMASDFQTDFGGEVTT